MKKNLLAILLLLFVAYPVAAQRYVELGQGQPDGKSDAGIRVEVLGGFGILSGKKLAGDNLNRFALHCATSVSGVFNNNRHALGLLVLYRYNKLYNEPSIKTDWHTVFLGPQYTWVSKPDANSSFIADFGLGGIFLKERDVLYEYFGYMGSPYTGNYDFSENGFGTNIGFGGRFALGVNCYGIVKLSVLASSLKQDNSDLTINVSSVNLSFGFSFGK